MRTLRTSSRTSRSATRRGPSASLRLGGVLSSSSGPTPALPGSAESRAIAAGQGAASLTFLVWHPPDLSELLVCRLEEWIKGARMALGLGRLAFAELIGRFPSGP